MNYLEAIYLLEHLLFPFKVIYGLKFSWEAFGMRIISGKIMKSSINRRPGG